MSGPVRPARDAHDARSGRGRASSKRARKAVPFAATGARPLAATGAGVPLSRPGCRGLAARRPTRPPRCGRRGARRMPNGRSCWPTWPPASRRCWPRWARLRPGLGRRAGRRSRGGGHGRGGGRSGRREAGTAGLAGLARELRACDGPGWPGGARLDALWQEAIRVLTEFAGDAGRRTPAHSGNGPSGAGLSREPKAAGADWTEERRRSDEGRKEERRGREGGATREGRRRLQGRPEARGTTERLRGRAGGESGQRSTTLRSAEKKRR